MNGFLAVARREVRERRFVFAAAAFASVFPFVMPLFLGWKRGSAPEARPLIATVLGVGFVLALAVGLGMSMLAPSMANRRIGFDLARPVSSLALWYGHLAATLLIAALAAVIIGIPAWLAGVRIPWSDILVEGRPPRLAWALAAGVFLMLVAAAHAASVMLRSRSALIALDAALALAAGLVLAGSLSRLPTFFAYEARGRAIWGFALAAGLGLLAAGFASVARGRTDIRAAHRALSGTLWASIAIGLVGVIAWTSWVLGAGPRDLESGFWVSPARAGSWALLQGRARGTSATFLYDTATGRFERAKVVEWMRPAISRDGKHAAWVDPQSQGGPLEVLSMSLDRTDSKPVPTRIFLPSYPSLFALSADGSRLATLGDGLLSIHDLAGSRTLASARIDTERSSIRGFFDGNDRFRVYRQPDAGERKTHLEILELDVPTKRLSRTGELERDSGSLFLSWDGAGERLITLPEAWLIDGRTGAVLARLVASNSDVARGTAFLADGRIVLTESSPEGHRLLVFGPDGTSQRTIPLPPGRWSVLGGEVTPGRVVVAVSDGSVYTSHLVDVDRGTVRKLADGLSPAARLNGNLSYDAPPALGSDATKLFIGANDSVVRLDPDTGARTPLLGGDPSAARTP